MSQEARSIIFLEHATNLRVHAIYKGMQLKIEIPCTRLVKFHPGAQSMPGRTTITLTPFVEPISPCIMSCCVNDPINLIGLRKIWTELSYNTISRCNGTMMSQIIAYHSLNGDLKTIYLIRRFMTLRWSSIFGSTVKSQWQMF